MRTQILQSAYSRGAIRDLARHTLPAGSVWKMTDWIPDLAGAPNAKRGGWGSFGILAGETAMAGVAYAPFTAGDQIVSIGADGALFNGTTNKGAAVVPIAKPVFFQNQLIIPGSTVKTYNGTAAPTSLAGAPANGQYAATYKSRLVLGVGNTLYFSNPGDPASYDVLSTIGVTDPITGIAALRNMIAIFSKGRSERIRGSIPPSSSTDGDMVLEPMFNEGCIDARSISVDGDKVIWANANGVFISDGAAIDNLIELGGLLQYWETLLAGYQTTWTFAGGLYGGYYVIAIMDGTTFVDALMCKLSTKTWTFLANMPVRMFANAYATAPELYMAIGNTNRVGTFSKIFFPSSANTSDGNGTAVQPVIELPFYRGAPGSKRWRNLYFGLNLDAPVDTHLQVEYTSYPNDQSYDLLTDDDGVTIAIGPTSGYTREKVPLSLADEGFGLRITQVGPSNATMLFDIEAETHDREGR